MPADKRVERGLPPPHFAYLRYERFLTTYQPPGWLRQSVLSFEDKKLGRGCSTSISQIVTDIYSSNRWDAVSIFLSLVSTRKVPKYKMYLESFYRRCYLSSSHIAFFKILDLFHSVIYEVKWSEVVQSCPTLCDTMDCSLPGSSIHGISQARILERVTISSSRGSSQPGDRTQVSSIAGFNLWATMYRTKRESHILYREPKAFWKAFPIYFLR